MLEFKKKTDLNTKSGCQQSSLSSKAPGNGTFFSSTEKKNEIFSGTRKIFKLWSEEKIGKWFASSRTPNCSNMVVVEILLELNIWYLFCYKLILRGQPRCTRTIIESFVVRNIWLYWNIEGGGTSLPILHWTWETPCIELGIARADPAQIFGYICYQFNELERNL